MSYNSKTDYYEEIGGISPSSSIKEIKKAYRKKALEYHPDKNPVKEEWAKNKFLELKNIYETLTDIEKKTKYDVERERYMSSLNATNHEDASGWTYTTNQNNIPVNFDPIPRTFVKSKPYAVYDYAKNSKQTIIRMIIYTLMFTMVLITIYMLSLIRQ